jgi:hypothetical protein
MIKPCTSRFVEALKPLLSLAVMVAVPTPAALTRPLTLTVAASGADELQLTSSVRSEFELSLKVPVAVSWSVEPDWIVGSTGVTDRPVSTGVSTTTAVVLEPPPPPPPHADSRAINGSAVDSLIKLLMGIRIVRRLFVLTIAFPGTDRLLV